MINEAAVNSKTVNSGESLKATESNETRVQ